MNDIIKKYAESNGVIAGVCDNRRLHVHDADELSNTPFVTGNIERRLTPGLMFPWTKSIIVIGVGYKKMCSIPDSTILRGRISQSAAGLDYHTAVIEKLEDLAALIQANDNSGNKDFKYKCFADTGDLVERSLAVSAGLGYVGKNRAVISKALGSYFNIGYMLTSLDIKPDHQITDCCPDSCNLCITACPGKALSTGNNEKPGKFDYKKCVSYLTQKKAELTLEEADCIGNWVYGCDVCQEVCPKNNEVKADVIDDIDALYPELDKIIGMNDDDFKKHFSSTAVFWRGRKTIARNAEISKKNLLSANEQ